MEISIAGLISRMTIYALSTGSGVSGIAVIRVSGQNTTDVIKKITGNELPTPRMAIYSKFNKIGTKELIDEGIIIWFPAPNSYTGEDLAEFHVHGSRAVINAMHFAISKINITYTNMKINLINIAFIHTMKSTSLSQTHIDLGAKMAEFAGYNMPISYSSINEEHEYVRNNVGVFDVSHMGEFIIHGDGAKELVQKVTSNNVYVLEPGKAQYSCLPNEKGGIVDDLIVYCLKEDEFLLVVNASNIQKDWD